MVPLDRLDDLVDAQVRPPPRPVLPAPRPRTTTTRTTGCSGWSTKLVAELRAESREAQVALVAGRLVRQELAQLRKRVADPDGRGQRGSSGSIAGS